MIDKDKIIEIFKILKTSNQDYVRLGSPYDGGYVMAKDFRSTDFVMSCGLGNDINFEIDIANYVGGIDMYESAFLLEKVVGNNSRSFKTSIGTETLLSHMLQNSGEHDDYILKMDIEGAEWNFFKEASTEEISKFRQMVVEFHWLRHIANDNEWYEKLVSVFSKIKQTHNLVILHGNNYSRTFVYNGMTIPDVIEVLFLRKDSYSFSENGIDRPEDLLTPCHPGIPEIKLLYN